MMTQEEYINKAGQLCPVCKSPAIKTMGEVDTDDDYAWQRIQCSNCSNQWDDTYKLVGYSLSTAFKLGEKE